MLIIAPETGQQSFTTRSWDNQDRQLLIRMRIIHMATVHVDLSHDYLDLKHKGAHESNRHTSIHTHAAVPDRVPASHAYT